jgi:hypothetical protein
LIFLMMRFGCGAHVMGHGHAEDEEHRDASRGAGGPVRWTPPETDIDPVCRMSVRTDGAKSSVYRGTIYYFCSAESRPVRGRPRTLCRASGERHATGEDRASSWLSLYTRSPAVGQAPRSSRRLRRRVSHSSQPGPVLDDHLYSLDRLRPALPERGGA